MYFEASLFVEEIWCTQHAFSDTPCARANITATKSLSYECHKAKVLRRRDDLRHF